jgi:hypothetical protein
MFNKRILVAPVIALAALAMSATQALSGGHPNKAAPKPHPGTGARPGGAIHRPPPQGHKPSGGLNHHPPISQKPVTAPKSPEITGKTKATPKGGSKPGVDRPGVTKLPPGVVSLPTVNSDRRWWGGWEGRWEGRRWDRDEHWWRHHAPWWGQSFPGSATSSVSVTTQPPSGTPSETNPADIIREMSRALESEKPTKFVDDQPKREK